MAKEPPDEKEDLSPVVVAVEDPTRRDDEEKAAYAAEARSRGLPVPRFLLEKDDPQHQPPHMAITELTSNLAQRRSSPYIATEGQRASKPHNEAMRLQRLVWESSELQISEEITQADRFAARWIECRLIYDMAS